MPDIELEFIPERPTKRTIRFMEVSNEQMIGVLYVKKEAFGNQEPPKSLKVKLSW